MTKTIVITGSSDGIGAAAARHLNEAGHRVVVIGRSPRKTAEVARSIGADHFVADFARLDDVRRLAGDLTSAYPRIDVLANNAGGVFGDPARTVDGFEKTFQINHLAPFLLTTLLMDTLLESSATVIQTSSVGGEQVRSFDPTDLNLDKNFSPVRAYGAAKLENILFTMELHRRYHHRGLSTAAFHPGNVATNFGSETTSKLMRFLATNRITRSMLISPEKGASQLVWLATTTPGTEWRSGDYYTNRKPKTARCATPDNAVAPWDESERLLSLTRGSRDTSVPHPTQLSYGDAPIPGANGDSRDA